MQDYLCVGELARTTHFVVNRVSRVRDGIQFAQKTLLHDAPSDARERFRNEARLLARLDHPNVIKVVDQCHSGTQPWIVTPLYSCDAREWMRKNPYSGDALDLENRWKICDAVLAALAYAHAQGVVHRDIKPANILLSEPTCVALIDFNISLCVECDNTRLTRTGQQVGTAMYIAPEQVRSPGTVDARADVFSFGVFVYELFGGTIGSVQLDLDSIPRALQDFVNRCTQSNRNHRFASAQDARNTWTLVYAANQRNSDANQLDELSRKSVLTPGEGRMLSSLLGQYSNDDDVLDRFFVNSDIGALKCVADNEPFGFTSSLQVWLKFLTSNSWPFVYTDTIANRCSHIFEILTDPKDKARIIVALLKIALMHNRFFVWRSVASLLPNTIDFDTAREIEYQISTACSNDEIDSFRPYVQTSRTHPAILRVVHRRSKEIEILT